MSAVNFKKILLLPGDGIGVEVVSEGKKIIDLFINKGFDFVLDTALIGGSAYDITGNPLPDETIMKAKKSNGILLGAVGGPKWESLDYSVRPERGLLGIRKELGLFANLRPAVVFDSLADASTLKRQIIEGLDILIVRELTGGIYFGEPRGIELLANGERRGVNTEVYTTHEIRRVAKVAFDLARKRNKKVCSIDKANVLEATELWRQEVTKLHKEEYSDIDLSHMYVDNASMQLVRRPKQFDVILTNNIFGDILSDTASMLTGSLGMLPSASLGAKDKDKQIGLYEPVHGSAPDIAGKNIANPIATILSLSMMFKHSFSMMKEANLIEQAIKNVLNKGYRTADIADSDSNAVSTTQMGDCIAEEILKLI